MGKFIDLTGNIFGRLTVIKRVNNKCNKTMWLCRCNCGMEKIVYAISLRSGGTRSCGCLHKEGNHKLDYGLASTRTRIGMYKASAKKRGFEYKLTEKQFKELTRQDCYYCGAKPNNIQKNRHNNGAYIYNGIDRVDNSKGYTIKNIVPCCIKCNTAKGISTMKEFSDWIKKIYKNIQKEYLKEGDNIEKDI
jgi:hypothetical protein